MIMLIEAPIALKELLVDVRLIEDLRSQIKAL